MISYSQRCDICKDVINARAFFYENPHGKKMCVHCFAEDFKKRVRIEQKNKIKCSAVCRSAP